LQFTPREVAMAQIKVIPIGHGRSTRQVPLVGVADLIVEDEPLIALDLHAALSAAGLASWQQRILRKL
jgi:hypothetical protein